MKIPRMIASLVFLIGVVLSVQGLAKSKPPLLVVGVYEGIAGSIENGRERVLIELGKLDTKTSLLLVAYEPIMWSIKLNYPSQIDQIFLGGYGAQKSFVEVNGMPYKTIDDAGIRTVYKTQGIRFRQLIETVPKRLGFKRIAGFIGAYSAPAEGFQLKDIVRSPDILSPQHLDKRLYDVSKIPAIEIVGNIDGTFGTYNLKGEFIKPAHDTGLKKELIVPKLNSVLRQTKSGIVRLDTKAGTKTLIPFPPLYKRSRHPIELVYDAHHHNIVGSWNKSWMENYLVQYTFASEKWGRVIELGTMRPNSMIYSAERERVLVSYDKIDSRKSGVGYVSEAGKLIIVDEFDPKDIPGFSDLWDVGNSSPVPLKVVGAKGEWIALSASKEQRFVRHPQTPTIHRLYVYNTETHEIHLTFYAPARDQNPFRRPSKY